MRKLLPEQQWNLAVAAVLLFVLGPLTGCWVGAGWGISEAAKSGGGDSKALPPTDFSLLGPFDGKIVPAPIPNLTWENPERETGFIVEVADNPTFTSGIIFDSGVLPADTTSLLLPDDGTFALNTPYYWRVKAMNGAVITDSLNGPLMFECRLVPWAQLFGGTDTDTGLVTLPTQDNGFIVFGRTKSFGAGFSPSLLIKLHPDASVEWSRVYSNLAPISMVPSSDGNIFLLVMDLIRHVIIKVGEDGTPIWQKKIEWNLSGINCLPTPDGGVILNAQASSNLQTPTPVAPLVVLIKLDAAGNLDWVNEYDSGANDQTRTFIQAQDGTYYISGIRGTAPNQVPFVTHFDSDGTFLWANEYDFSLDILYCRIFQAPNQDLIVTPNKVSSPIFYGVFRMDPTGTTIFWTQETISRLDKGLGTLDGNILLYGIVGTGLCLTKLDPLTGAELWAKQYPFVRINQLHELPTGDLLGAGFYFNHPMGAGGDDFVAVKMTSAGSLPPIDTPTGIGYTPVAAPTIIPLVVTTTPGAFTLTDFPISETNVLQDVLLTP